MQRIPAKSYINTSQNKWRISHWYSELKMQTNMVYNQRWKLDWYWQSSWRFHWNHYSRTYLNLHSSLNKLGSSFMVQNQWKILQKIHCHTKNDVICENPQKKDTKDQPILLHRLHFGLIFKALSDLNIFYYYYSHLDGVRLAKWSRWMFFVCLLLLNPDDCSSNGEGGIRWD